MVGLIANESCTCTWELRGSADGLRSLFLPSGLYRGTLTRARCEFMNGYRVMLNGKKAIALYRALMLHTAKWIATGGVVISATIFLLGVADVTVPGLNWSYSWQSLSFALAQLVIFAAIRRIIVNALNRSPENQ